MKTVQVQDTAERHAKSVSVVIPAYNEAGNLGALVEEILQACPRSERGEYGLTEIVIVDDGSTDETADELRALAQDVDVVTGVFLSRNFGQSAALAAGIDQATGDVIVTMDADRQNDPADIPRLLSKLEEGYDCVSGWRKDRKDPLYKTLPSKIQTYLGWLTGSKIHDFGCTLKAYRSTAIKSIDIYGEGHRYIPAKLYSEGFSIREIPVNHRRRDKGRTKYGARRLVRGSLDLLFNVFWNRYSTRPLHFFGVVGMAILTVGLAIGVHSVYIKYVGGVTLPIPRLILVAVLTLFGVQLFIFGFLAEMIIKIHYRDKQPFQIDRVYE